MYGCDRGRTRRDVLRSAVGAAAGGFAMLRWPDLARSAPAVSAQTPVALTSGDNRGDNVLAALRLIESRIKRDLARYRRVVVKPNMVISGRQLAASHVDCLEPICDFLRSLHKGPLIITDSSASGPVTDGYENYGYYRLRDRYNVEFRAIDDDESETRFVSDHELRPHAVRMSKLLLDPETYIVSAAMPKTHDRAIVTLSLKNVVVGAAKKDATFKWGVKDSGTNDKTFIHGGPRNEAIHYNMFQLARELHPNLSVIDGFEGMEGNGPCAGDPVPHRIAIAGADWLAADRVAVELMGFDFAEVGYLSFAAQRKLGQGSLDRIDVLGAKIADHIRRYRPHDTFEQQLQWARRHMAPRES